MSFEGADRQYRIVYPQHWVLVTPMCPVFSFHACSQSYIGNNGLYWMRRNSSWDYAGPDGGFMVIGPGAAQNFCWNNDPAGEDVPFVETLINEVEAWSTVDPTFRRMYGMSGGGYMSNVIGCLVGAAAITPGLGGISDPEPQTSGLGVRPFDTLDCVAPLHVVPVAYGHEARDTWADVHGCTAQVPMLPLDDPAEWCTGDGGAPPSPCGCVEYTCASGSLIYCEGVGGHNWYNEQKVAARELFDSL